MGKRSAGLTSCRGHTSLTCCSLWMIHKSCTSSCKNVIWKCELLSSRGLPTSWESLDQQADNIPISYDIWSMTFTGYDGLWRKIRRTHLGYWPSHQRDPWQLLWILWNSNVSVTIILCFNRRVCTLFLIGSGIIDMEIGKLKVSYRICVVEQSLENVIKLMKNWVS